MTLYLSVYLGYSKFTQRIFGFKPFPVGKPSKSWKNHPL